MTEVIIDDTKTIIIIIITNTQGIPTEKIFCTHDENQQKTNKSSCSLT